jgi:cation transport ATPase
MIRREAWIPATALLAILLGLAFLLGGHAHVAHRTWMAGLFLTGIPVVLHTFRGMLRGKFAADVVAMLAIITAALLATPLPGLIVVLMQTGGEALEAYAEGRELLAGLARDEAAPVSLDGSPAQPRRK